MYRQSWVGSVDWRIPEPGTMILGYIMVRDEVILKKHHFLSLLREVRGKKPITMDFQRRGLGSTLLEFVIAQGRSQKIEIIRGGIVQGAAQDSPWLPEWYRKHGFQTRKNDGSEPAAVAVIIERFL